MEEGDFNWIEWRSFSVQEVDDPRKGHRKQPRSDFLLWGVGGELQDWKSLQKRYGSCRLGFSYDGSKMLGVQNC